MSVVIKNYVKNVENDFTPDNILDTIFSIFEGILAHTKNFKNKCSSIFDHIHQNDIHHKQDSDPEEDFSRLSLSSTSTGSDSSSEDGHCCILDKYGIEDFVVLCYKCLDLDEHMLIMAMMNLDRLLEKNFVLTEQNIHKVFFLCMMEVHKYYNDVTCYNKDYAKLCGISTKELLNLEFEFMNYIDYNMNIPDDKYELYKKNLKKFFERNVMIQSKYL
jgi:hypothetical protein